MRKPILPFIIVTLSLPVILGVAEIFSWLLGVTPIIELLIEGSPNLTRALFLIWAFCILIAAYFVVWPQAANVSNMAMKHALAFIGVIFLSLIALCLGFATIQIYLPFLTPRIM